MGSIINMDSGSLARKVMTVRVSSPGAKGITVVYQQLLSVINLPELASLLKDPPKKSSLKSFVKKQTVTRFPLEFLDECVNLCLSDCELKLKLHRPILHRMVSIGNPLLTRRNNFRIRLLVSCDGLEKDAARFSSGSKAHTAGPCCKLCGSGQVEDAAPLLFTVQPCPPQESA